MSFNVVIKMKSRKETQEGVVVRGVRLTAMLPDKPQDIS